MNANFAISVSLLGEAAALSGNLTNTVLASQLLKIFIHQNENIR